MNALQEYFQQERGRVSRLADGLKINSAAISQWDRVPAERVLDVESITGISRHDLRPDLYPRESTAA